MTDSEILQSAVAILRKQEAKGRAKYGADLDSFPGTASALSAHKVDELADALCYAIAEQQSVIELETENAALKARVAKLESQVSAS